MQFIQEVPSLNRLFYADDYTPGDTSPLYTLDEHSTSDVNLRKPLLEPKAAADRSPCYNTNQEEEEKAPVVYNALPLR